MDVLKHSAILIIICALLSCYENRVKSDHQTEEQKHGPEFEQVLNEIETAEEMAYWSWAEVDTPTVKPEQSGIGLWPKFVSNDNDYPVKILIPGEIHGDELHPNARDLNWLGIALDADHTGWLKKVNLEFKATFDPVLDDSEEQATGIEVKPDIVRPFQFFLSEIDGHVDGMLNNIPAIPGIITTGESFDFEFAGNQYRFIAVGDYQLFIQAYIDGQIKESLISSVSFFEESMIEILFVGDLDGDEQVDLIIDHSHKYNAFTPVLFLSRMADQNELVGLAGISKFVGS